MSVILFKRSKVTTCTVAELIARLEEFPEDMGVAFQWESQVTPVDLDEIWIEESNLRLYGSVLLLECKQW